MNRIHRFSGIYLSLFITVHLLNHLTALHSISSHLKVMQVLRIVYKQPIVEGLLLLAVLLQVGSGLSLVVRSYQNNKKRKQPRPQSPWKRWQRYSGLYLAFFLCMHTGATLHGQYVLGLDTNFYFAAKVVQALPEALFFVPYYGLGVLAYVVHLVSLWRLSAAAKEGANRRAWLVIGLGVVLALLLLTTLLQPMKLPVEYQ